MPISRKIVPKRVVAFAIAASLCAVDASAAVKEVTLWGARSANDLGSSDVRIEMEDLKKDYSGYLQTDGMTEFFHKDSPPTPKTDMTEASAWLIDNGVISRDEYVSFVGTRGIPSVSIRKADLTTLLELPVRRSDALMYLYKATFGPLYGRVLGVETPNVRTDDGALKLFSDILKRYQTPASQQIEWIDKGENGKPGTGGSGVGSAGQGGSGGQNETTATTQPNAWRYTPQGDEYTSVWGDTNVFISENHFNQTSNGGSGGNGGPGVAGGVGNSGSGGSGGDGGDASNIIRYETDYKSIDFVPGADVIFYRTTDVVEMYLQALHSKGLLAEDSAVRTAKFSDVFLPLTSAGAPLASWSGSADPYIVNQYRMEHVRVENVQWVGVRDILGSNYTVSKTNNTVDIKRHNLFASSTGYFATEDLSRMDVYRYIYTLVYANEKKLSDLERDIVNYKFGVQFDGYSSQADVEVLKYLIAKGILDYANPAEFAELYSQMSWQDFVPILYRVANKNARLDFSVVQLTDSEQSWQARGFYPQTVQVVDAGVTGSVYLDLDGEWVRDQTEDEMPPDVQARRVFRKRAGFGVNTTATALASVSAGVRATPTKTVGALKYNVDKSGAVTLGGFYFDFRGAQYIAEGNLVSELELLLRKVDRCSLEQLTAQSSAGIDLSNPKHVVLVHMLKNIYVLSALQSDSGLYNAVDKVLTDWEHSAPAGMPAIGLRARQGVASGFRHALTAAKSVSGVPSNISYTLANGSTTRVPASGGDLLGFAKNLRKISFSIPNTTSGARVPYSYEYSGGAAISGDAKPQDIVSAVNNSAVELSKRVTEVEAQHNTEQELQLQFTQLIGSSLIDNKASSPAFEIYRTPSGAQAFVSWSSVEAASQKAANSARPIPIVKISDTLLYNTETDTYAYFALKDGKREAVALVGTEIITGDPELGVAFKSGEGETATYYYHFNAIKALLNAGQENAVIGGVPSIAVPSESFRSNVSTLPLVSESGVSEGSLSGIRALVSRDDARDRINFAQDSVYMAGPSANNKRWGDYLTLSQSNRVMNIVSRRVNYNSGGTNYVAYAVVRFVPVDISTIGTTPVGAQTSLQDLLDAPGMPPADPSGRAVWAANKALCNAYANWIYGTANQTYIETGYLKPEATLYVCANTKEVDAPPASLLAPLTPEQRAGVRIVPLGKVGAGAVIPVGTVLSPGIENLESNKAGYWLSADCAVLVHADRVYVHSAMYPNLEVTRQNNRMVVKARNTLTKTAAFTVGSTFKIGYAADTLPNGQANPTATVVETTSTGLVRCQVGPIRGLPVSLGSTKFVLSKRTASDSLRSLSSLPLTGTDGVDVLRSTFDQLFKVMPEVSYVGIQRDPYFVPTGKQRTLVFDGSGLGVYEASSGLKPLGRVGLPNSVSAANTTPAEYSDMVARSVSKYVDSSAVNNTVSYILVEFPAYRYKVFDGRLMRADSSATEFLSPALFSNLNDLIIDDMINSSNGAIPVNEIPQGSLLKLGNTYYHATTNSTSGKTFIGYSYINSYASKATVADAAVSFASEFVRAGNQYMNVSHFFREFEVLGPKKTEQQIKALSTVAAETLSLDSSAKYSVDANGNVGVIVNKFGGQGSGAASTYAPVSIKFADGLLAYKVSSPDAASPRYVLCSTAQTSVSGCFDTLPFFQDNILDTQLADRTSTLQVTTFKLNQFANVITSAFMDEFGAAFRGDLFTLARMILFLVICWLILASWVCYACRLGNLLPILDTIKYPSGNRQKAGVDVMKIFSLGTISLETEFGLGRFLMYNAILCCLILVVDLTGNISVPM